MPNKHASIKDLRKSKKRQEANTRIKTNVNAKLRQAKDLLKNGKTKEAQEAIRAFQQAADKAAKRNVISRNKMNRKKSALMKMKAA